MCVCFYAIAIVLACSALSPHFFVGDLCRKNPIATVLNFSVQLVRILASQVQGPNQETTFAITHAQIAFRYTCSFTKRNGVGDHGARPGLGRGLGRPHEQRTGGKRLVPRFVPRGAMDQDMFIL